MYTFNRTSISQEGAFGLMIGDIMGDTYYTLEHVYQQPNGSWLPKVPVGIYTCNRHPPIRLPYETFELENTPDFMGQPVNGILIHIGNYLKDSEGCILIGKGQTENMITNSKEAFDEFMKTLEGINSFDLTIK